uniref:Uncharacterized protein LOC114330747 n=1 Tax=Diabrotica virgifera virgifera TaxID=50390 RepID=A0A6P7FT27_DIAVI
MQKDNRRNTRDLMEHRRQYKDNAHRYRRKPRELKQKIRAVKAKVDGRYGCSEMEEPSTPKWIEADDNGHREFTDEDIVDLVQLQGNPNEDEESEEVVSLHIECDTQDADATKALGAALLYLEQNSAALPVDGERGRRAPSLRLANGRVAAASQSEEEIRTPPPHCRLAKDDSIKISIENTNTCTDSLVTAIDDETLLITDYLSNDMNYKGSGKVHFDDVSLYGTPKEEPGPTPLGSAEAGKQSFIKNQLQALFQPTDNKLAMKLFGSKKALMKERIRQKAAGHWVIHPCSSFR